MSVTVTAAAVNELRKRMNLPMMECKSALVEADGDMDKAVDILRVRFKVAAGKRENNETSEGRIGIHIDTPGKKAAIVELRCESAPVVKSEAFIALAADLAKHVAQHNPPSVEAMLTQPHGNGTVTDRINEAIGTIRENMKLQRFKLLHGDTFGEYVHHDGTLGVLVQFSGTAHSTTTPRDVAMHIAAVHPVPMTVRREEVPADLVAREKAIAQAKAEATGKPAQIAERIAEGQMKTWFGENVLLEQPFIKESSKTVGQLAKEAGLEVVAFARFKVGDLS